MNNDDRNELIEDIYTSLFIHRLKRTRFKIELVRPAHGEGIADQSLPVFPEAIHKGDATTNFVIEPGDKIVVSAAEPAVGTPTISWESTIMPYLETKLDYSNQRPNGIQFLTPNPDDVRTRLDAHEKKLDMLIQRLEPGVKKL